MLKLTIKPNQILVESSTYVKIVQKVKYSSLRWIQLEF